MALSLIIVLGAFVWLLYETRWLTVRLAAGAAPSLTHRHIPFREALPKPPGLRTARAQVLSGGMKAAIVFLIAVTAAEVVTNFTNIFWGIISHSVILIALIAYSTVKAGSPDHKLFLTLCLAPLTRIVSLAMPLTRFPVIFWYIIIYPTLMVGAWVTMRRVNYTPYEVGLNARNLKLQWLISLSGILLGVMEYVILRPPQSIIPSFSVGWWLFAFVVMLGGTGLVEEFIFRGVAQKAAVESLGRWGIPYMAYIFAVLHLIHHSPIDILFVGAVGLYFGWLVSKTGSIVGVTLAHGLTNFLLYIVLPSLFPFAT